MWLHKQRLGSYEEIVCLETGVRIVQNYSKDTKYQIVLITSNDIPVLLYEDRDANAFQIIFKKLIEDIKAGKTPFIELSF